jgi:Flp pilus assembly protein TadG
MIRRAPVLKRLREDERGLGAVEFALIIPVFFLLIFGIMQMGTLFYAHAALRNAVSEGARFATIHPRPSNQQIIDRIRANRADMVASRFTNPVVTVVQESPTTWRADISMSYTVPVNFMFFNTPVVLSYSRRTYVYPPPSP